MAATTYSTAGRWKKRAVRAMCHPLVGRAIGVATRQRVPTHGLRIDVSDPVVSPVAKAQMLWGLYEGTEVKMIRRHLAGASLVVELGASLGVTGAHAASVMAPGGRYVGVEANPALVDVARRTVAAHAVGQVDVVHGAIDYRATGDTTRIALDDVTWGGSVLAGGGVEVPVVRLADIVGDERYVLVSDIEGAEEELLAQADLSGCDAAVFELHQTRTSRVGDLIDALVGLGFRVVDQHGPVVTVSR